MMMGHVGLEVPNEYVHAYVSRHPDKLVGVASVDPHDPECCEQLRHAVRNLGFRALKLSGAYQNFDPLGHRLRRALRDAVDLAETPLRWAYRPARDPGYVDGVLERGSLALLGMA